MHMSLKRETSGSSEKGVKMWCFRVDFRSSDKNFAQTRVIFVQAKKTYILGFVYEFLFYYCLLFLINFFVNFNYIFY